jgi:hypothetical protein
MKPRLPRGYETKCRRELVNTHFLYSTLNYVEQHSKQGIKHFYVSKNKRIIEKAVRQASKPGTLQMHRYEEQFTMTNRELETGILKVQL